jgi:hypothetical protein
MWLEETLRAGERFDHVGTGFCLIVERREYRTHFYTRGDPMKLKGVLMISAIYLGVLGLGFMLASQGRSVCMGSGRPGSSLSY